MTKALLLYHSQEFGNTKKMAEAVAEGLKEAGCQYVLFNTNEDRFDVPSLAHFDCVAIGSPDYFSYVAGGLKTFMDDHYVHDVRKKTEGIKGKPYVLFYSHGGGGRVKDVMVKLFSRIGTQVGEPLGSYGAPSEDIIHRCRELGKQLASAVKK
jgi:flavorubredoxin